VRESPICDADVYQSRRKVVLLNGLYDNLTDEVIGDGDIFQKELNKLAKAIRT